MDNLLVWVDIPVRNLDRAMRFYSGVFDFSMESVEVGPRRVAMLPFGPGMASGALVEDESHAGSPPSAPLVYLRADSDLEEMLGKVVKSGGKIIQEKESLGKHGFRAIFEDSEGNPIALHRMN